MKSTMKFLAITVPVAIMAETCGELAGVRVGPLEFSQQQGLSTSEINFQDSISHGMDMRWENNDVHLLSQQYEVLLSNDNGASHTISLGMVSAEEGLANVVVRAQDICPPRYCCRAFNADCLACTEGLSVTDFCARRENQNVAGCGATTQNNFCCMALTAECQACTQGKTVAEMCAIDAELPGCEAIEAPESNNQMCCLANTAECNSCHQGVSIDDYCKNRSDFMMGCYDEVKTSIILKSSPILGCSKTAESKPITVYCPKYTDPAAYDTLALRSSSNNSVQPVTDNTVPILSGVAIGTGSTLVVVGIAFLLFKKAKSQDSDINIVTGNPTFDDFKVNSNDV